MNKNLSLSTLIVAVAFAVVGCEKSYDIESDDDSTRSAQLTVRTAANVDGSDDATDFVSYPVNVYVMNKKGKCVALQSIGSASDAINMLLDKGNYDVYAIGSANSFNLPSQDVATKADTILPKNGTTYGDLMTAYNNVQMADGEENKLTLQLERKVMQVESVTLTNIPTDVEGVSLTVTPLYDGITLNGDYTAGTTGHSFSLTRQSDGTTWKSVSAEYMLPSKSTITLKVSLQRGDSATAYSYACGETLEANHKVTITGTYVDDEHVTLSGTLAATDWADPVSIDFSFNSSSREDKTEEPEEKEADANGLYGGAPAAGTAYKGCYVLRTENVGDTTVVTLITPTEKNSINVSTAKDTLTRCKSNKNYAQEALKEIKVSGINGWRFPSLDEVRYLWDNVEEINKNIAAIESVSIVSIATTNSQNNICGYYYLADNNYVYICNAKGKVGLPPANNTYYKVRGFATIKFYDK